MVQKVLAQKHEKDLEIDDYDGCTTMFIVLKCHELFALKLLNGKFYIMIYALLLQKGECYNKRKHIKRYQG